MTILHRILSKLRNWWGKRFDRPYQTHIIEGNLPERLRHKAIYLVQEHGYAERVSMICPCGCQQVLHMNVMPDDHPCWQVTTHPDQTISLHPSVWRKIGCKSHFWFQKGRIYWCEES